MPIAGRGSEWETGKIIKLNQYFIPETSAASRSASEIRKFSADGSFLQRRRTANPAKGYNHEGQRGPLQL